MTHHYFINGDCDVHPQPLQAHPTAHPLTPLSKLTPHIHYLRPWLWIVQLRLGAGVWG